MFQSRISCWPFFFFWCLLGPARHAVHRRFRQRVIFLQVLISADFHQHVVAEEFFGLLGILSSGERRFRLLWRRRLLLLDFHTAAAEDDVGAKRHRSLACLGLLWADKPAIGLGLGILLELVALARRQAAQRRGVPIVVELVLRFVDSLCNLEAALLERALAFHLAARENVVAAALVDRVALGDVLLQEALLAPRALHLHRRSSSWAPLQLVETLAAGW